VVLRPAYARQISATLLTHVSEGVDWMGHRSPVAERVRAAALLLEAGEFLRSEDESLGLAVAGLLKRLVRSASETRASALDGAQLDLLATLEGHVRTLLATPWRGQAPWERTVVSEACRSIPTMLNEETMHFYKWLGGQVSGEARIVELGAWLGASTRCLCEGLDRPGKGRPSIDVFDSFVWEPWMDPYVLRRSGVCWPKAGESFLSLFYASLRGYDAMIVAHPCWIDDGVRRGDDIAWARREPIELLLYDMGPDRLVLDTLWEVFSPFFQRGSTVLVFNEYGKVHSSVLWDFCERHADRLRPHHKPYGSAKAFLYV
jgi:hypothetical protein